MAKKETKNTETELITKDEVNLGGRPTLLTDEIHNTILYHVGEVISLNVGSGCAGIPFETAKVWMRRGEEEAMQGIESPYSRFFTEVRKKQSERVSKVLIRIQTCPKNWQALAWFLERCARTEFGSESPVVQDLIAKLAVLEQNFASYTKSIAPMPNVSFTGMR